MQRPGNSPVWSGTYEIEGVDNADRDLRATLYESTPSGAVALGLSSWVPHDSANCRHKHLGLSDLACRRGTQLILWCDAASAKSSRLY